MYRPNDDIDGLGPMTKALRKVVYLVCAYLVNWSLLHYFPCSFPVFNPEFAEAVAIGKAVYFIFSPITVWCSLAFVAAKAIVLIWISCQFGLGWLGHRL